MGMTMTQKLLAAHAGKASVTAGELIEARLDLVMGNDVTTPVAIAEFEKAGFTQVFDPDKIAILLDHFTPCKDIAAAKLSYESREFAKKHHVRHFYDVGRVGIEHALLPEQGIVAAGDLIIGADSHTCTYGALGAFSTGVGSTDMAAGMASGLSWFRVPEAISIRLTGALKPWVSGKDVILHLIGMIGVDGALYQSMEFSGPGVASLTMDDRFTICNMAIEAGGKNGIFPVDEQTIEYMTGRVDRPWTVYEADPDAEYARVIELDLSQIEPTVSLPHLPSNAKPVSEVQGMPIQQAVIGSCTNGRISDMRVAARVLRGRKVADGVRCIVIPATQEIYLQCVQEGLAEVFVRAGAVFSVPTCGPCLGGHMGVLYDGERAVSTTNRNFVGRMGHTGSEVVLASPAVAAASAVAGCLCSPDAL